MPATTLVLDPTAPRPVQAREAGLGLGDLAGRTVGFVDNAKPNFEHLAADLGELLQQRLGVARVLVRRKRAASLPAPAEVMDELAAGCDLVIAGSGD